MSVVNKMLQDLEARKSGSDLNADYQAPQKTRLSPWVLFALVIFIAAASWFVYIKFMANSNPPLLTSSEETKEQTREIENANDNVVKPLQSSASDNNTRSNNDDQVVSETKSANQDTLVETSVVKPDLKIVEPSPAIEVATKKPSQLSTDNQPNMETASIANQGKLSNQVLGNSVKVKSQDNDDSAASEPEEQAVAIKSTRTVETQEDIRRQVQIALSRSDNKTAIQLLKKLLNIAPDTPAARKRLTALLFSQKDYTQADVVLAQGIQQQPDNIEFRMMQAKLHVQLKNPQKAHDLLIAYGGSKAQTLSFLSYRAVLAQQLERFSEAQKDYQQLTQLQPAQAKWWLGLAIANERLNNPKQALSAYRYVQQLSQLTIEVEKFVDQRIQYLAGVN